LLICLNFFRHINFHSNQIRVKEMETQLPSERDKYLGLQILRFVAATFVVVNHAIENVLNFWPSGLAFRQVAWSFGEIGVIVFFAISGFIMVHTQYESFGKPHKVKDFIVKRIIRIVPLYILATTLQFLNKIRIEGEIYTFSNYLKSLLFIPYIGEGANYRPILGQGWTLNYEMFFYVVFAFALFLPKNRGLIFSMLTLALLSIFGAYFSSENLILKFYTNPILLYFISGMVVAVIAKEVSIKTNDSKKWILLSVFFMFLFLPIKRYASGNAFTSSSILLVFVCIYLAVSYKVSRVGRVNALLEQLGNASYSTYLFHGFVLGALKFISMKVEPSQPVLFLLFILFAVFAANAVGLVIHTYIEKPVSHLFGRAYTRLARSFV
jgi:exopolysaccharide production protein ExoZ